MLQRHQGSELKKWIFCFSFSDAEHGDLSKSFLHLSPAPACLFMVADPFIISANSTDVG